MVTTVFIVLLVLSSLVNLYTCLRPNFRVKAISKVLLMPALTIIYLTATPHPQPLVVLALLFGMLGDIFLLPYKSVDLFVPGVLAFGMGHVFYAVYIFRLIQFSTLRWYAVGGVVLFLLVFGFVIYSRLRQYLKREIKPYILLYITLICAMSLFAGFFFFSVGGMAATFTLLGALLFLVSDSILSFELFRKATLPGDFLVMLTYISAQCLLIYSFI